MQTTYLIIRFSSLGDIILTSPVILNLKIADPASRIIYLTKERYRNVAEMIRGVDEVVTLPEGASAAKLFNLLLELDSKGIDTVFDLHGSTRSWLGRKIIRSNAVTVYPKRRMERWRAVRFKEFGENYPHTIDLYNSALTQIGVDTPAFRPLLNVGRDGEKPFEFEDEGKPLVLIAPGAAHSNKKWPVSWFAEAAEILHHESKATIVWAVMSGDEDSQNRKPKLADKHLKVLADTSIPELADVIAASSLTIANDSGIAHLSSAVGTPVLALFGPTHPALGFAPRGIRDRIIQVEEHCRPCSLHGGRPCYRDEQFCFNRITPSMVVDESLKVLELSASAAPALFIDRDGTLIENRHYLADPDGVEIIPGGIDALKAAKARGYRIVVLSNQSGVARGLMTVEDVERVNSRVGELCAAEGLEIDRFYYCPHHPNEGSDPAFTRSCDCRKPAPGMAEQAAHELNLDLRRSIVVGDSHVDTYLGRIIGARSALVRTGYGAQVEAEWKRGQIEPAMPVFDDLPAAVKAILSRHLPEAV